MNKFKNILITGSAGFIASNTVKFFVKKYPNINFVSIDKIDYCSSFLILNEIKNYENHLFYKENINNSEKILDILEKNKIDTVINFAAQSHVDNSYKNSKKFIEDNILGTYNLLEASKKYNKLKLFIQISTDEVYDYNIPIENKFINENYLKEDQEDNFRPKNEYDILRPTNFYASTKAASEMISHSYFFSYKLPLIITRSNNIFGPGQYPEKIIPKFINNLLKKEKLPIQGDGNNIRSFLYIEDFIKAIELILMKGEIGEIYNIGTNNEKKVIDVASDILKILNYNLKDNIIFVQDRPYNDKRYFIDSSKIKNLGWNENSKNEWNKNLYDTFLWFCNNKK